MTPPLLIGVSGYARSGKDSAGRALTGAGWQRRAFADRLKATLYDLNPGLAIGVPLADFVDLHGWEDAKDADPEVRALLQRLGVAVRRHVGMDAWVNAALRCRGPVPTVVTDVRFPNEVDGIRDRGGIVIRVERPGVGPAAGPGGKVHESETALDGYEFDHVVPNDGTLEQLHDRVLAIAALHGWQPSTQTAA